MYMPIWKTGTVTDSEKEVIEEVSLFQLMHFLCRGDV